MPQLNAYLAFDGNCAEAMRFYERALGGKMNGMMTVGQSPMAEQMPPGSGDRIMHSELKLDGGVLMAADTMQCGEGSPPYEGIKGVSLALTFSSAAEAAAAFGKLGEGGKVTMPLDKTFWAETFGMLTDRFGVNWIINGGMLQS
jgi:PhnB protein